MLHKDTNLGNAQNGTQEVKHFYNEPRCLEDQATKSHVINHYHNQLEGAEILPTGPITLPN